MYAIFLGFLLALIVNSVIAEYPRRSTDVGQETIIKFVPYLVQLRNNDDKFFCSGTLIAPQYVVTANSCFSQGLTNSHTVVVGGATTTTEEGVKRRVTDVIPTNEADIAVLKLDQPMTGASISTLKLSHAAVGRKDLVQIAGWGQGAAESLSAVLRTSRFSVVTNEKCANDFKAIKHLKIFCASGAAMCSGDLGSPAVNRGKLVGILVDPKSCDESGASLAFTSVFETRSFIESALE